MQGTVLLTDRTVLKIGLEEFLYEFKKPVNEKVKRVPDPIAGQLQLMLGIISELHTSVSLQNLLDNAIDGVLRLTRTKRGYGFMVENTIEGLELKEVSARQAGGKPLKEEDDEEYTISQSAIHQVLSGNGSVIVEDALSENINTETIRRFKLKSIVCLPLKMFNQNTGKLEVIGIIYADSLMPSGKLPKHCRSTLQLMTEIISSNILNWQHYDEMKSHYLYYDSNINVVKQEIADAKQNINYINNPDNLKSLSKDEIKGELEKIRSTLNKVSKILGE